MSDKGFLHEQVPAWLVWLLVAMVSALAGNLLQSHVHLNHDVAWIAHSARWLLRGQTFGTGVLDPNPPMAWFLSMPAAGLAELGLMPEPSAVRLVFWGYFFVSAALLFRVLSVAERSRAFSIDRLEGRIRRRCNAGPRVQLRAA